MNGDSQVESNPDKAAHSLLEEIALDQNHPVQDRIEAAQNLLHESPSSRRMGSLLLEISLNKQNNPLDRIVSATSVSYCKDERMKELAVECLSSISSDPLQNSNARFFAAKALFRDGLERMHPSAMDVLKEISEKADVKDRIKAACILAQKRVEEGYDVLLQIAASKDFSAKDRIRAATSIPPRNFSRNDKKNNAAIWWLLQIAGNDEEDVKDRVKAAIDAAFWWNELTSRGNPR